MRLSESIRRRTTASLRLRFARWWVNRTGFGNVLAEPGKLPLQHVDLLNLYWTVRRRKPRIILEFGIGDSTIFMAEALKRNGSGTIIAIEANKQWLNHFHSRLPEHLSSFVMTQFSELEATTYKGEPCHRYVDAPTVKPDLMYLDGPDPRDVPGWPEDGHPIAADPLYLEPSFPPGFRLIVDTRLKNCEFLERHFTRKYRKHYDDIFKIVTYDLL